MTFEKEDRAGSWSYKITNFSKKKTEIGNCHNIFCCVQLEFVKRKNIVGILIIGGTVQHRYFSSI